MGIIFLFPLSSRWVLTCSPNSQCVPQVCCVGFCLLSFSWVPRPSVRLILRSECFCLLFVKEPMKPYRTCPKRIGCESPFVVVRHYPLTDKIDCCMFVAHIGIQWTRHPTSFLWGCGVGWGGGGFINFYVYPVRRGCQELTR